MLVTHAGRLRVSHTRVAHRRGSGGGDVGGDGSGGDGGGGAGGVLREVHRCPASKAHPRRVGVGIRGGGMVRRSAEDAPR